MTKRRKRHNRDQTALTALATQIKRERHAPTPQGHPVAIVLYINRTECACGLVHEHPSRQLRRRYTGGATEPISAECREDSLLARELERVLIAQVDRCHECFRARPANPAYLLRVNDLLTHRTSPTPPAPTKEDAIAAALEL